MSPNISVDFGDYDYYVKLGSTTSKDPFWWRVLIMGKLHVCGEKHTAYMRNLYAFFSLLWNLKLLHPKNKELKT